MRRLLQLEKKLAIPQQDRLFCDGRLGKAEEVRIEGVRIRTVIDLTGKLAVTTTGATKAHKEVKEDDQQTKLPFPAQKPPVPDKKMPATGKSIWRGRDAEEVNVEIFALQHYEERGFKG